MSCFGLGGILNGSTVISGSELVPFFNPQSQLFDQAKGDFSELTNGYEFRVRYSFLTTWVRHYKVLPFALLFMLPAIVWSAYLITSWFIARVFTQLSRVAIYAGTAFPTALIYLITIYAKITHFYTLVLGLCLFTVSGSRDARRDPLPRGPLAAPGGPGLRDHSSQPRGPLFGALRALHGRHGHDPCSRRVIEVDPRGRLRAPALTPARPTPAAAHSWRAVEPLHPPLQHDHSGAVSPRSPCCSSSLLCPTRSS